MAKVSHRTVLPFVATLLLCVGCATVPLDEARRNFNSGALIEADRNLASLPNDRDRVLYLMERGMIRHVRGDYTNSTSDWLEAVKLETQLETHSLTKAGASMIANDSLLSFRGYPYEQTLLHVYLAKNYLARGLWEDAAVESRSIARRLQQLDGFPDDALSRYITAFCFELCGDYSNAAMQYRETAKLVPQFGLDEKTGRFTSPPLPNESELVCFIDFDSCNGMMPEFAEIYAKGQLLGASRTLFTRLAMETASSQRMAARRTAKVLTRIALKESLALYASSKDNDLGGLVWLLLFSMEKEDVRRWETLPEKMAVVRISCPDTLAGFDVVLKSYSGAVLKRMTIQGPLLKKGRIFVGICRDKP